MHFKKHWPVCSVVRSLARALKGRRLDYLLRVHTSVVGLILLGQHMNAIDVFLSHPSSSLSEIHEKHIWLGFLKKVAVTIYILGNCPVISLGKCLEMKWLRSKDKCTYSVDGQVGRASQFAVCSPSNSESRCLSPQTFTCARLYQLYKRL